MDFARFRPESFLIINSVELSPLAHEALLLHKPIFAEIFLFPMPYSSATNMFILVTARASTISGIRLLDTKQPARSDSGAAIVAPNSIPFSRYDRLKYCEL
jgi:hypothetical protein